MGYTHYWNSAINKPIDLAQWHAYCILVREALERLHDDPKNDTLFTLTGDAHGEKLEPIVFNDNAFLFNCMIEPCETFYFNRTNVSSTQFCKTARYGYDYPVCVVLTLVGKFLPQFYIRSDGDSQDIGWKRALDFCQEFTGLDIDCPV